MLVIQGGELLYCFAWNRLLLTLLRAARYVFQVSLIPENRATAQGDGEGGGLMQLVNELDSR